MKWMALGMVLIAAAVQAPVAQAAVITFATSLSGPNESPPNASPGTGNAVVTINDVANTMAVRVDFTGLLGTTTASHIHCCTEPPGTAMVATTTPTFPDFPLGVTSGTYDRLFSLLDPSTYNPAFITAHGGTVAGAEAALIAGLEAGEAYLNPDSPDGSMKYR